MGQQQLLLIVLGVIVVGIAVVVGINLFNANAVSANRDGVVSDLNNLGAMAQQFYKKPTSMGGGGNKFAGNGNTFALPAELDTTANGIYVLTTPTADLVTINGYGTELAPDGNKINHKALVGPSTITVTKVN